MRKLSDQAVAMLHRCEHLAYPNRLLDYQSQLLDEMNANPPPDPNPSPAEDPFNSDGLKVPKLAL